MNRFLITAAVAFTFLSAGRASAYCRTTTTLDFQPTTAEPCDLAGTKIFWVSKCAGYSLQKDASVQVDLPTATALVHDAFGEWAAHDCSECGGAGASGKPSIVGQDLGPVSCDKLEANNEGNANIIMFRDATWPHDGAALALTTVSFNKTSGEIFDVDMEVQSNPKDIKLTLTDPVPPNGYDLRSIFTHEAGHFLGLAHTQPGHADATMFATYLPGETTKRTLSTDDVCGICDAYPPTRSANCDPTPVGGLTDGCGGMQKKSCNCTIPGAPAGSVGFALALAIIGVTLARRRP